MKTKKKSSKIAGNGARGMGFKPARESASGGQSDFTIVKLPLGAEEVPMWMLEDDWVWVSAHNIRKGQYFNEDYIQAPLDPDDPKKSTFIDRYLAKNPDALANDANKEGIIKSAATYVAITVFCPKGIPDKKGEKWYQPNTKKLLLVPAKQMAFFEKIYRQQSQKGRTLKGLKFLVSRGTDKMKPKIGDIWIPDGRLKLEAIEAKLKEKQSKWPLAWDKIIPRLDKEGFAKLVKSLRSNAPTSTEDDSSDDGDDIPF